MSVKRNSLRLEPLHAPEHTVWALLMVKPRLQLLHMSVRSLVQAAPILGEPFRQMHLLAAQDTHVRLVGRAPS